jgi:hypothetical protein
MNLVNQSGHGSVPTGRSPSGAWAAKWRSQVQLGNENRPYDTGPESGLPIGATQRVAPTENAKLATGYWSLIPGG